MRSRYGDFGPTLAAEKLAECHGISIKDETLQRWLRERGIDHATRRSACTGRSRSGGLMWGSCSNCMAHTMTGWRAGASYGVLMDYIDDVSSRVCARFCAYEVTISVMVDERVEGMLQMTQKDWPLMYRAIVARPLRVTSPPKIALPQRPVTSTRAHLWRTRLLPT